MATCGNCKGSHQYAESVGACYRSDRLVNQVSGWVNDEGEYEPYDR